MKKILIFFIIFSLFLNSIPISFIFSQTDNQPQNVDFSAYKLQCDALKPVEIKEEEMYTTSSIDYISELEAFAGNLPKSPSFFESLIRGLIGDLIAGLAESILGALFGKVPVGAKETNEAILTSVKESTKNVLASIKTSIQLAIQDAIQYFKFQLLNKLNEFIYGKILKNFIKDIEAYRNFKIFLGHQRVFNRVFSRYKDLQCIPQEIKGCLTALLNNAKSMAFNVAMNAENSDKLIRFLNAFYRYQEFEFLNKKDCEPYEKQQIYQSLNLIQPLPSEEELQLYEGFSSLKKPETYIAKVEKPGLKMIANIFNLFKGQNIRKLTAQIFPGLRNEIEDIQTIFLDLNEPFRINANIANCFIIQDRYLAQLIGNLAKEDEKFKAQIQQPGGFTFKPKTQCLKTWAEIEYEEILRELEDAMEKGDTDRINKLDKKKNEILKKIDIERQKDITGEDPNCVIPGPTLSSPSDYEKLKEQILTSPLEIFKTQEKATNFLVAFLRSWLASKLFKIIDKGFASLEAKTSSNIHYLSDIKNAYSPDRINKICSEFQNTSIPGSTQMCRSAMESQLRKITDIERSSLIDLYSKVGSLIKNIVSTLVIINTYNTNTQQLKNDYSAYLNENYVSLEKLDKLDQIIRNFENRKNEINDILNLLSTNTGNLKDLLNKNVLDEINSEAATLTAEINKLDNEINKIKEEINKITSEINQKISNTFYGLTNLHSNKIATFFNKYFDLEKNPLNNPKDFIGIPKEGEKRIGENPQYESCPPSLGNRQKLSFFNDFYPTHVKNCLKDKNFDGFKVRFDNSYVDINLKPPEEITDPSDPSSTIIVPNIDKCYGKETNNPECATFFIIHDLIYIYYSLYNSPASRSGIQQEDLITASYNFLTNLITNPPKVSPDIIHKDLDTLYDYFRALENYASNTIKYATDRNLLNIEFLISNRANHWNVERGEAILLRLEEALEIVLKIGRSFKEIIGLYKEISQQNFLASLQELQALQQEKDKLVKEYEQKVDAIWNKYLSALNPEEVIKIQSSIEQNLDKINTNISELIDLCEEYNSLIEKIEEEINNKLKTENNQQDTDTLPPEEPPASFKEPIQKISLVRRFLNISIGVLANIFESINIFKPRKIYIK